MLRKGGRSYALPIPAPRCGAGKSQQGSGTRASLVPLGSSSLTEYGLWARPRKVRLLVKRQQGTIHVLARVDSLAGETD